MSKLTTQILWAGGLLLSGCIATFGQAQDAAQQAPKPPKWEKSAALGLTLTRGNSETLLFTGNILASRKDGPNEYNLGADLTYGESSGKQNANAFHGFGQYNRLFGNRAFGYFRVEGLHDEIALVRYRFIISPGAGYYFIKNKDVSLRGEVGPGYITERLRDKNDDYATLRVAERYDHKLSDKVKLWQTAEFLPQVDKFENYILNAELGVDTSLTPKLSLRSYVQDTYKSRPAFGRKRNDVKLVTAIAYKF